MTSLKNFFLFCSGTSPAILKRSPVDTNKYLGIGATIFFTGLFSALAAFYAVYTVFNSIFVSILFAGFWGLMIFNLDRYLVSSMKRKGSWFRDFSMAVPRLALAALIAVVIAKPLELKIFQSEIDAELVSMEQEKYKEQEDLVKLRFDSEIEKLQSERKDIETNLLNKEATRDALVAETLAEADGTGGSMRRNLGPIYRAKKAAADKAEMELLAIQTESTDRLLNVDSDLQAIQEERTQALSEFEKVPLNGFAARLDALSRLSQKSSAIALASLFIMLLFIAIETAPIFVKLISTRSPYDFVLDEHEEKFRMWHKLKTGTASSEMVSELGFVTQTGSFRTQEMIKAEKKLWKQKIEEEYGEIRKRRSWKDVLQDWNIMQLDTNGS